MDTSKGMFCYNRIFTFSSVFVNDNTTNRFLMYCPTCFISDYLTFNRIIVENYINVQNKKPFFEYYQETTSLYSKDYIFFKYVQFHGF